ncbi:MerR family DNA-binding transcriptional regulator [Pseudonocardia sp. MCCB 268]|nr:MerR family DNA-binding transcriptional regulator [Pseudonocardia cytotoxica]
MRTCTSWREDQGPIRTTEAARAPGVSPATLRRWSRAGKVKPAERTLGGQDR